MYQYRNVLRDLAQEYGARVCILANKDDFGLSSFGRLHKYENLTLELEQDLSDWDKRRIEYIKAWKPKRIMFADRYVCMYVLTIGEFRGMFFSSIGILNHTYIHTYIHTYK